MNCPICTTAMELSFSLHLLYRIREFAMLCGIGLANWHQDMQDSKKKQEQGISHNKVLKIIVFSSTVRIVNLAKWI